mmetsp:Transcript_127928/g.239286  ORF Transcript_127928/g.239286 Transcript_127928/m.239286 type:complete len:227 (+) Transcript_127928:285-965(+)
MLSPVHAISRSAKSNALRPSATTNRRAAATLSSGSLSASRPRPTNSLCASKVSSVLRTMAIMPFTVAVSSGIPPGAGANKSCSCGACGSSIAAEAGAAVVSAGGAKSPSRETASPLSAAGPEAGAGAKAKTSASASAASRDCEPRDPAGGSAAGAADWPAACLARASLRAFSAAAAAAAASAAAAAAAASFAARTSSLSRCNRASASNTRLLSSAATRCTVFNAHL